MKFLLLILPLLSLSLTAQTTTSSESKQPIIIRNAESLIGSTVDSQLVRELVGSVHLEQGNVTVYCDHATQYTNQNRAVLQGNVRVIQGTVTMLMPRGDWDVHQ